MSHFAAPAVLCRENVCGNALFVDCPPNTFCRGQAHLIANDFRKAAADLQKSTELCSTMAVAWAAWGVALFKLGMADGQVRCPEILRRGLLQPGQAPWCFFEPFHHFMCNKLPSTCGTASLVFVPSCC